MTEAAWLPILRALADGEWHSGQALATALGVSRAAIWKQVRRLEALSIRVEHRKGRGYRLSEPIELLDADRIQDGLDAPTRRALADLFVLGEVDSTNSWLHRESPPAPCACLAEVQSGGRGRRGRGWISAPGRDLCVSVGWEFSRGLAALGGLSLAVSVGVARALKAEGIDVGLKWPNDILVENRKLGGILIEAMGEFTGPCRAIIGVGINLNLGGQGERIGQPWIDLATALGGPVRRNRVAGRVLHGILSACKGFEKTGLASFVDEWRDRDVLAGREVIVEAGGGKLTGTAAGIDERGALLVDSAKGRRVISGGEVSVRSLDREGLNSSAPPG